MQKKIVRRKITENSLTQLAGLPLLLRRIYAARGVQSAEDVNHSLSSLLHFNRLTDIDCAVKRLADAIAQKERILIVGDFDTDGATSTVVAILALRALGAKHVDFMIPNRFTFGYGLTPEIVEASIQKSPRLIVTVDNGISSVEGVARANNADIDVIVTDHHLQGSVLPDAFAIVNPNRESDGFESKSLAGVGVIFYVMLALRAYLASIDFFSKNNLPKPNLAELLDLVALGTVADVVPLDKNNRILVHQGLQRIRAGLARPGICALLQIAGKNSDRVKKMTAIDLGFVIAPRLNAAGRLDDMSLGVQCLLSDNFEQALQYAEQLNQLNVERRVIESEMKQQAFEIIDRLDLEKQLPLGVCLFGETWHQGVVGLVASRVKDKLHRPVIAFAKIDEAKIKGSARSVDGVPIRDVLEKVAAKHPAVLSQYGGHAMAAGLSIKQQDFDVFSNAFNQQVSEYLTLEQCNGLVESDGELISEDITLENVFLLQSGGPWGQHFPEPIFDGEFEVISQRLVGGHHLKLILRARRNGPAINAIAFNVDITQWPNHRVTRIKLAYRLDLNEYQGCSTVQLMVEMLYPL